MMKQSQKSKLAPPKTGCPDCHKPAKLVDEIVGDESNERRYQCETFGCAVVSFTVDRFLG
jgi:hypothetical protein